MFLARASFFKSAIFGGLDSWHCSVALCKKVQAMVALFSCMGILDAGNRVRSSTYFQ